MPMTIVKAAALAVAVLYLAPLAARAQNAGASQSERGMPDKTGSTDGKSERAMPGQTTEAGTPPAKSERAMPAPEKK